jgi:beta-glucuronidase
MMNRLFDENKNRNSVSMNGIWKFKTDPAKEGVKKGWAANPPALCAETPVPSLWTCAHGFYRYEGAAWYFREFEGGGYTVLAFHGVTGLADVYVDGEHKGSHYGGFTGFQVSLKNLSQGKHLLALMVDNTHTSNDTIPLARVDWYHHGGISRGVELYRHRETRIVRFLIRYQFDTPSKEGGIKINFEVVLESASPEPRTRKVKILMNGRVIAETGITFADSAVARLSCSAEKIKLWSPASPELYRFDAELEDEKGNVEDGLAERTGFRKIEAKNGKILLNGEEVKLRGINRHEEHPDFGWALPLSIQYKDMAIIKEAGCNAIRGSHYPNAQSFLDLCDEEGILFWEEIPMWGFPEGPLEEPLILERGLAMHTEMVERDMNHPSIIIWGLHNEIDTRTKAARNISEKFAGRIRSLDASRLLTFATMHPLEDICLSVADVVSVNKYFGWYQGCIEDWEMFLEDFYQKLDREGLGNKPVIISEFGAGGVPGVKNFEGQKWSENCQEEYLDYTLGIFLKDKRISGTYIWQYCDIRVCDEHIMGRPRGFNNKGIVDEYRRPKLAYKTVKFRYGGHIALLHK